VTASVREKPQEGVFLRLLNESFSKVLLTIGVVVVGTVIAVFIGAEDPKPKPSAPQISYPIQMHIAGTAEGFNSPTKDRADRIGFIGGGQKVTALEKAGGFYKIRLSDGKECWVQEGYLKPTQ
jgi:hypothetical protein